MFENIVHQRTCAVNAALGPVTSWLAHDEDGSVYAIGSFAPAVQSVHCAVNVNVQGFSLPSMEVMHWDIR